MVMVIWASFIVEPVISGDWSQFLGPRRNGYSEEQLLADRWPAAGPPVLWKTPLGVGMSGLAIVGPDVITMFQDESHQYVVCLKTADGKERWRTPVADAYQNAMGDGPRATPAVVGDVVYALTGEGLLTAIGRADGKLRWSVNALKLSGGQVSEYGMSGSPLVHEDRVIVHSGGKAGAVLAVNAADGAKIWLSGSGNAGYASPALMSFGQQHQIVSFTASGVAGIDPASGRQLWHFEFSTDFDVNTANPVQLDEHRLLISAGENHGSVVLNISGQDGRWAAEPVWTTEGPSAQLRAEWQTPLVQDGHLYGLDNSGAAGPITNLVCIRLSDYTTVWKKARFGKANAVLADHALFMTTMDGDLVLVNASPEQFSEASRFRLMEPTRTAPSLSGGKLFVRDNVHVYCVDVADH